jgi:hypothetical protein
VTAATWNITFEQAASFALTVALADDAGQPVSLAGCQARMQVRSADAGAVGPPLADLSTANGGITIAGDGTSMTAAADAAVTAGWTWGPAVYDLIVASPDGTVTRLLRGDAEVSPAVTDPIGVT